MSDPRNAVAFEGIGYEGETFLHDASIVYDSTLANGSAQVGLAAKLVTDETAALTTDGSGVKGKIVKVESDGKVVLQTEGYTTLPGGDGATLTIGEKIVGAAGPAAAPGYIRAVATGTAAELGHAMHEIINNNTTTAVVVKLGA